MFDGFFRALAETVAFFYSLTGDYAAAIALLTLSIMLVFTPLTVKGSRSMSKMSQLQPLMKKIQAQHKGDRLKAQQEMSVLYQRHNVKPLLGCLPLLLQLPVFFMLYQVVRGLSHLEGTEQPVCSPKYIGETSPLYEDIVAANCEMRSLGMDLAQSANTVVQDSFVEALPYLGLVALMAVLAWLQQFQAKVRRQTVGTNPQMEMLMKFMPFMLPVFSFIVESGLTIYFGVSSIYRLAQQEYIHRTTKPLDLDAGPLVTEPEPPKPVPHQRSQKAIDAEASRREERAARSRARRESGDQASRMGQGPAGPSTGPSAGPPAKPLPAVPEGHPVNEDPETTNEANDRTSQDEPPEVDRPSSNGQQQIADQGEMKEIASRAQRDDAKRRSLFGRSRGAKQSPEQAQPIQSRRTAGDGRRRNKKRKK